MTSLIPEILAPAGGRQQFLAALSSGADAVYLGLKHFNARARAENFTMEDLTELVPLAHRHGMKVLVTLNILIKESELSRVVEELVELETLGVDAVIVQDLGVVSLMRRYTPNLRIHGSTQMAIHNLAGIQKAREMGISRVVLAREMTATELVRIRRKLDETKDPVEVEVFCHGSLCYSYSGLCFFSGAADARSGNRGECAYTCRKPYKIVSEPGQGFLFSMKDLDTSKHLDQLIEAGVHTLKIEGRKKDAQYVSSTVRLYRDRLDHLFGFPTGRSSGRADFSLQDRAQLPEDLKLAFQRDLTGFFVKGRYHENVIDLDHSSHQGAVVGPIVAIHEDRGERIIQVKTQVSLDRYDGIRVVPKDEGWSAALKRYHNHHLEFSLREVRIVQGGSEKRLPHHVPQGTLVEITLPKLPQSREASGKNVSVRALEKGDLVYKVRSQALKERVEKLALPPEGHREVTRRPLDLEITWLASEASEDSLQMVLAASVSGRRIHALEVTVPAMRSTGGGALEHDLGQEFRVFGHAGFYTKDLVLRGDEGFFVPRSQVKQLKKQFSEGLKTGFESYLKDRRQAFMYDYDAGEVRSTAPVTMTAIIKLDRIELLGAVETLKKRRPDHQISEVVFEPKKAFLDKIEPSFFLDQLQDFTQRTGIPVRIALPTVIRGWDEPLLKLWTTAALERGNRAFEVGNLGALKLLEEWNEPFGFALSIEADFTVYGLNSQATDMGRQLGFSGMTLSIEDDQTNLKQHLIRPLKPQDHEHLKTTEVKQVADFYTAIVYKDTPLFIAEACSLTALHKGCPSAKVCGYRTLEVENPEGERFFVAHETCKSIVYGAKAFAITQHIPTLARMGIKRVRLDFLTRPYTEAELIACCEAAFDHKPLKNTHSANFTTSLL